MFPQNPSRLGRETPLPIPLPLDAFGVSIWAPAVPRLLALPQYKFLVYATVVVTYLTGVKFRPTLYISLYTDALGV